MRIGELAQSRDGRRRNGPLPASTSHAGKSGSASLSSRSRDDYRVVSRTRRAGHAHWRASAGSWTPSVRPRVRTRETVNASGGAERTAPPIRHRPPSNPSAQLIGAVAPEYTRRRAHRQHNRRRMRLPREPSTDGRPRLRRCPSPHNGRDGTDTRWSASGYQPSLRRGLAVAPQQTAGAEALWRLQKLNFPLSMNRRGATNDCWN